jgi:hypothetical protein
MNGTEHSVQLAEGDKKKNKLLVYMRENPQALKNFVKYRLPLT